MQKFIETIEYIIEKYRELKEFKYDDISMDFDGYAIDVVYKSSDHCGGWEDVGYLTITQEIFAHPRKEMKKIKELVQQQKLKRKEESEERERKRGIQKEKDELESYKKLKLKYEKTGGKING